LLNEFKSEAKKELEATDSTIAFNKDDYVFQVNDLKKTLEDHGVIDGVPATDT